MVFGITQAVQEIRLLQLPQMIKVMLLQEIRNWVLEPITSKKRKRLRGMI